MTPEHYESRLAWIPTVTAVVSMLILFLVSSLVPDRVLTFMGLVSVALVFGEVLYMNIFCRVDCPACFGPMYIHWGKDGGKSHYICQKCSHREPSRLTRD